MLPIADLDWARSPLGTPIALYSSASIDTLEAPILLIGGTHGDEPLGVELAEQCLADLTNLGTAQTTPWILIPRLNPDGLAYNTRVNGRGVDLNRNYPSRSWNSLARAPRYNPGPSPASEPEICALAELILTAKPRLLIHCHSWHPMIVCTGAPGRPAAQALAEVSGYNVVDEIGYPTPGSLSEFAWFDHSIPVICIEENDDTPIGETWPRFAEGLRKIFREQI